MPPKMSSGASRGRNFLPHVTFDNERSDPPRRILTQLVRKTEKKNF